MAFDELTKHIQSDHDAFALAQPVQAPIMVEKLSCLGDRFGEFTEVFVWIFITRGVDLISVWRVSHVVLL